MEVKKMKKTISKDDCTIEFDVDGSDIESGKIHGKIKMRGKGCSRINIEELKNSLNK